MKPTLTALTCASLLTGITSALAADEPAKPAATTKPAPTMAADNQKTVEGQYLFPSPADLLDAVQHSAKIDWKGLSSQIGKSGADTKDSYAEDSRKALNLGMRVADAFVAVAAKDKDQFLRSSKVVAKLAADLSAQTGLPAKREEARKLVEAGNWPELGNLLEQMRFDVLRDFKAVPDEDSVILANLGGWLRGLDLVAGALGDTYSADATKVLRQAGLVAYLKGRLEKLEAPASTSKEVGLINSKLPEIESLCSFGHETTLPQDKVKRLHELTTELVQAILN